MAEQHGKALVPQIRFAGFTDPWEQRKLGELTESYSGGTPAAGESEFYGGSIPFIRSAEIAAESTELFLTEKGYESSSARMVKPGDVLYALYGATSGEVAVSRQKGAINQAILAILPRDDCDARYITAWLRKQKGYIVTTYLQGGQGNLSGVIVKNLEVFIPSLPEQQKIGFMLSHLDSLITLHQRKYDKLCVLKKSMLDKMFPKGGSLYPEIRFAGFTDPWEQRKLGELCSFSKGCGYSKNDLRDQGTPIILYGRLYTNYETQIHSVDTFVKPLENSVYSEGGEVIIPASGETAEDISIASVVEKPGIILGGDLNVITSSADIDPVFLALELSYGKPHFDLAKRAQGKSVVHIHNEDIANVFFGHPNIAEQRRIGAFFDRLDSLITLHQRKLELLRNIKKSMLDKMFV